MNEIIISNIPPQNININEGGVTGITTVYVNGVDVTVGNNAYVLVPTKLSELQNDTHFITQESDPTVPTWIKAISISDINNWNSKQNQLTAGTNIEINDNVISAPLTDYVKFTDYADYGKAGVIKPQSGSGEASLTNYGFGINSNGQPFAYAASSYIGYDRLHFNAFISKETLETAIEGKELTNKTYVDSANTLQDNEINDLKNENDYLNSIINQLPKVSSQGTILTLNNTINGRMNIELGASELSQDGTPTPSSPQDIHTISGSNKVVVCGKNLFNPYDFEGRYSIQASVIYNINNDKSITMVAPDASDWSNNKKQYLPAGTYILSMSETPDSIQVWNYDTNSQITRVFSKKNVSFTLTEGTNIGWKPISFNSYPVTFTAQLEKGNTATTYTPYVSQEANIDLGDIELCKIGDYQDYIYKENGNWYKYNAVGKVVLDGTQTPYYTVAQNDYYVFQFSYVFFGFGNKNVYSNRFINASNWGVDIESLYVQTSGANEILQGKILTSRLNEASANGVKNWFSANNTDVYYVLATPTTTQITGTLAEQLENVYQKLLSYKGQTNISQINNDLPFVISASALLDLNTLVGE